MRSATVEKAEEAEKGVEEEEDKKTTSVRCFTLSSTPEHREPVCDNQAERAGSRTIGAWLCSPIVWIF